MYDCKEPDQAHGFARENWSGFGAPRRSCRRWTLTAPWTGLSSCPRCFSSLAGSFRVRSSAHKTCDGAAEIREMDNTVHLEGLRCDGGAHDGCQAACPLFWREEWLSPASEPQPAASTMTR